MIAEFKKRLISSNNSISRLDHGLTNMRNVL